MNYKYVTNIIESEGKADMLLGKQIGNSYNEDGSVAEYGIDGYLFASEIKNLYDRGFKDITVNINTIGGSVVEGYMIADAVNRYGCTTRVIGLAASMGAVIACMGAKRVAANYATLMYHPVSSSDETMKGISQDSLINMVTSATRMNGDVTKQLFEKETYFSNSTKANYNLAQAKEMGLLDEIEETGKKVSAKKVAGLTNLYAIYNKLNEDKNMDKVFAALKLDAKNQTEVAAVEAVEALNTEVSNKDARIKELETENAALKQEKIDAEAAKKAEVENKAKDFVKEAINKKLVKAEDEAKMVALAVADFDTVKNLVEAKAVAIKPVHAFNADKAAERKGDGRENWTIRDFEKNDPKELKRIKNESPELYKQMYDNFYVNGIGNPNFKK